MLAGRQRRHNKTKAAAAANSSSNAPPAANGGTPIIRRPGVQRRQSFDLSSIATTTNQQFQKTLRVIDKKSIKRRSSHLSTEVSTKDKFLQNDTALKNELVRLESTSSEYKHPMGFNLLSALRILNAPGDKILNNTGYWIQPEDLDDIPGMFDSYLNVNCLYYSLVGVLAVETSLFLEIPNEDAPLFAQWLITVSRFCWAAIGVWSFAAVVASFHILWCVYATPTWAKRRFVFDNSRTISVVYALGAPNFAMMLIGTITGVMGNIFNQEGYTNKDWISAAAGLFVGTSVCAIFVLCSGSLINKCVRPWKIADENLRQLKDTWAETHAKSEDFYDNYQEKEDPDGPLDFHTYNMFGAGFDKMGMPFVATELCKAGLTLEMLQRVDNEVLLDQLLQRTGLKPGECLRVLLYIRDSRKEASEEASGETAQSETSAVTANEEDPPRNVELDDDSFRRFEEDVHRTPSWWNR